MNALRKAKALVLVFAVVALLAGMLAVTFSEEAQARPRCCIWVMMCTTDAPIVCWEECLPVPCP